MWIKLQQCDLYINVKLYLGIKRNNIEIHKQQILSINEIKTILNKRKREIKQNRQEGELEKSIYIFFK